MVGARSNRQPPTSNPREDSVPPVIACFEVEPWEEGVLRQQLAELELRATHAPLRPDTLDLAQGATLATVFIYSRLSADLLAQLPDLRCIATRSTGYDHIDLETCRRRGIVVSNVPTYGENTVAEHTFGLILSLSRKIHQAYVRTSRGDFSLQGLRGFDLKGRTLGVVGAGNIGLHVVRIGRGFGMEVLAHDAHPHHLLAEVLGFRYVPLEEVLRQADIVTLHVPYRPNTHHLIDRARLAQMKRGSLLINTARGGLVDTEALLWALDEGILAGAGLDVLEGEELIAEERQLLAHGVAAEQLQAAVRGHLLLRRENVVVTPHIAFNSEEALQRILDTTVHNVHAFLAGEPANVVP
ncbi:MAG: hydroxyacid dehydrogenase [Chloroflexi bacterium]|nr:hydroxyacid dehydrogenase [Chloroflexota bacterium]